MKYYLGELRQIQANRKWSRFLMNLMGHVFFFIVGTFVGYLWMAKAYGLFE